MIDAAQLCVAVSLDLTWRDRLEARALALLAVIGLPVGRFAEVWVKRVARDRVRIGPISRCPEAITKRPRRS